MRLLSVLLVLWFAVTPLLSADDAVTVKLSGEPGPYTVARWKTDWPGCEFQGSVSEGRISLVSWGDAKALRVAFAKGQIGPENGGAG